MIGTQGWSGKHSGYTTLIQAPIYSRMISTQNCKRGDFSIWAIAKSSRSLTKHPGMQRDGRQSRLLIFSGPFFYALDTVAASGAKIIKSGGRASRPSVQSRKERVCAKSPEVCPWGTIQAQAHRALGYNGEN